MIEIVWTEPAVDDLQAIVDYIGRDSVTYAAATSERVIEAVGRLAEFPRSGRAVPELHSATIREIVVPPYRVVYRHRSSRVEILAVVHAARDFEQIKGGLRKR